MVNLNGAASDSLLDIWVPVQVDWLRLRVLPCILDSRHVTHFTESHGSFLTVPLSLGLDGLNAVIFFSLNLLLLLELFRTIVAGLIYSGKTGFNCIHCIIPALFMLQVRASINQLLLSSGRN